MRILMTTDTVGGVWTFTSELTEQLLRRGHSVHLVSFGRNPSAAQQAWADQQPPVKQRPSEKQEPSNDQQPSAEPEPSAEHRRESLRTDQTQTRHLDRSETVSSSREVERPLYSAVRPNSIAGPPPTFTYTPTDIPLEWMQNNERAFEDGQTVLLDALQSHPADLILSNQFCFGRLTTSTPCVVVAHSDVLSWARACKPSALDPTPWLNRYTAMVQGGLLEAAAVVTPTAWMGKALSTNFFLPRNLHVIPNGVTVAPASDAAPSRKLQAITAGRLWDEGKGLDTLTDLATLLPLLVAGDNSFYSADRQIAWPKHLTNLGPLSHPDLHRHFRASAIYLCTSRYEPFGLAPLEAALCGCTIVARDLPSLREVWADSALYFNGTASLTNTLQALADDAAFLAEAQRRAGHRAAQYTAERMATSYLHLFQSTLQQPQVPQHVA